MRQGKNYDRHRRMNGMGPAAIDVDPKRLQDHRDEKQQGDDQKRPAQTSEATKQAHNQGADHQSVSEHTVGIQARIFAAMPVSSNAMPARKTCATTPRT